MITDEQVYIACDIYDKLSGIDAAEPSYMRKTLEAYEQSKPKPEPVAYTSRKDFVLLAEGYEISAWSDSGAVEDEIPLYTTPPTREPLSEDVLMSIAEECTTQFFNGVHQNATIHFARAVEQAHGIGVTND